MNDAMLLDELAGGRTQTELGVLLGTTQSFVSMVYRGVRRLGATSVRRLIAAFPERRDYILNALFPLDGGHE